MATRIRPPRTEDKTEQQKWRIQLCNVVNEKECTSQDDSTASDVAALKADFNALLAKLRAAKLMES